VAPVSATSVTGAVIDLGLDHEMTARIGAKPNLAIEAGDVSGTLARWSLGKLAAGLHAGVKRSGPIVVEVEKSKTGKRNACPDQCLA
jgi:hypothetical protein